MKRKLLLIVASLLLSGAMFAQSFHWTGFDYHAFQKHMNIIGKAYIDGVVQDNPNIEIATFVNGELRGTKFLVEAYPGALPGQYFVWNACYYDNEGETFTFKAYDHANGIEYDICDTELIGQQNGHGSMENLLQMHFTRKVYGPEFSTWIPATTYSGEGMTVVAQIRIDGQIVDRDTYVIGAFCGDECRATSGTALVDFTTQNLGYFAFMNVHGNDNDIINFYLYDMVSQSLAPCKCFTTVNLINGSETGVDILGGNIFILNFVTEHTFTKDIVAYTPGQKDHYYLIASPIGDVNPDQVTNMLENSYDLYYFDQTGDADGKEWINYKTGAFNLVSGKGYLYANNTNVTLTFSGFPFLGDSVVTLYKDGNADFPGWNLVGNPLAQTTYINKSFYVMNTDGTELQGATAGTPISAMEGIFVIAENNNETLTFSTQAPSKGATLVINVTQGNRGAAIDRAIVGFGDTDMLPKFMLDEENTKVYIPQDGRDYAIVSAESHGELPLNFKTSKNGNYTLSFNTENVDFSYLHLIDNKTGNDVDLLLTPSYNFEAQYTDYESRFKLVFDKIDDGMSDDFAFITNGNIVINGKGTVQIIDALGRILAQYGNNVRTISTNGMTPCVYVLRLINGNDVKTQKIIVR